MSDTARVVTTFYLTAGIWLAVMLGTAAALLRPMGAFHSAIEAAPEVSAFTTTAIAIVVATVVAGAAWSLIRIAGRSEQRAHRAAPRSSDDGSEARRAPTA